MTSCQTYLLNNILVSGPISLQSLYKRLNKFSKSTVRRSLYELRDQKLIFKNKNDLWETNK